MNQMDAGMHKRSNLNHLSHKIKIYLISSQITIAKMVHPWVKQPVNLVNHIYQLVDNL